MKRSADEVIEDITAFGIHGDVVLTAREFTEAMRVCYSRLNYEQFCKLLGIDAYFGDELHHGHTVNQYGSERYDDFRMFVTRMGILDGGFMAKLVKFGIEYQKDLSNA